MTARRLALHLPPEAVTAAWYAQDCPPVLDITGLSRWTLARWALSRLLRGLR